MFTGLADVLDECQDLLEDFHAHAPEEVRLDFLEMVQDFDDFLSAAEQCQLLLDQSQLIQDDEHGADLLAGSEAAGVTNEGEHWWAEYLVHPEFRGEAGFVFSGTATVAAASQAPFTQLGSCLVLGLPPESGFGWCLVGLLLLLLLRWGGLLDQSLPVKDKSQTEALQMNKKAFSRS